MESTTKNDNKKQNADEEAPSPKVDKKKTFQKGKGRKFRDSKRSDTKRETESVKTVSAKNSELDAKYLVENRTELENTLTRIIKYKKQIQQSSRGVGLAVVSTIVSLREAKTPPRPNEIPLFALYRVSLAMYESKLALIYRNQSAELSPSLEYREFRVDINRDSTLAAVKYLPKCLASLLDGLGVFSHEDITYVPTFNMDRMTRANTLIPDAGTVLYSNLRTVVQAMANMNTAAASRTRFVNTNPLPGAIYVNNVLQNADDICPANYVDTLATDVREVNIFFTRFQKPLPWIVPRPEMTIDKGNPACAVIGKRIGSIPPVRIEELLVRGYDITADNEYISPIKLKGIEWIRGVTGLFREPNSYTADRYPYWDGAQETSNSFAMIADLRVLYGAAFNMYI